MARPRKKSLSNDERFWHRLTLALGYSSVESCKASIGDQAAHDWWLFDQTEPIGNREIRHQLAFMCSVLWNAHRTRGSQPVEAADFLFRSPFAEAERQLAIEQGKKAHLFQAFKALAAARAGGPPKRRKAKRR